MNDASKVEPPAPRYEKGFILDGLGINTEYEAVQSEANTPEIEFSIPTGTTIDGYMHNHFFINEIQGGQPIESINIFSDHDLFYLYILAKNNHVNISGNFVYIQVYQDEMYHLQIENMQDLIDFGDNWFVNESGSITDFLKDSYEESSINHENSPATNRDNFARLIKTFSDIGLGDLGIELYVSNVEDPDWKKVHVNSDNSISLEDCI